MKKLTFQINNMGIAGGAERVVAIWSNYLVNNNYKISIATENGKDAFYDLDTKVDMEELNYFSFIKFLPIIRLFIFYKFLKSREDNETIVFHKYIPTHSIYIFRRLGLFKNLNLVYFAHGGTSQFINFYKKHQTKKIFRAYDKVICLFEDLDLQSKLIEKDKIVIISNPVAINLKEISDINSKKILAVGRLAHQKGYDMLLDSWKIVNKELKDIELIIVGSGELEEDLKQQCENYKLNDSVTFISATKTIEEYYLKSAIFVIPSRFEGLPMVLLEALESGLPIISYDIDGNRNLVRDNGILINCFDTEAFARAIIDLYRDKEKRIQMSKLSKQYSKENKIENIAHKWNEVL